jgi:hypothetical protein
LFANPANLKFIDMAAVQAAIEQQKNAADGEKNLKALFGIGSEEDVSAVAALGLEIQSGLSAWLTENGFTDAGTALAKALGTGVEESSAELGAGIDRGLRGWVSSEEGAASIDSFAKTLSDRISGAMKITPPLDLPTQSGTLGGTAPTGAPAFDNGRTDGRVRASSATVIVTNSQIDVTRAGQEIARRMRR